MEQLPEVKTDFKTIEDMLFGTVRSRLLQTGVALKLFDLLDTPKDAETVSKALCTHPKNTGLILNGLAACGLLTKGNRGYANNGKAAAFLNTRSPTYIGEWLTLASRELEPVLSNMHSLVKNGPWPHTPETHMNSEEMCEHFTRAHGETELAGISQATARIVKALPEFDSFEKMLDLGGGPGLNSVAIVGSHPRMTGVVFDRQSVVAIAREYIQAYGMEKRIDTMAGDYYSDPLGQEYDLILASDTLYYEPDNLDAIAAKLYHALTPGGILVGIHGVLSCRRTAPANLVLGMLSDALTDRGELPDSGFLAPALLKAGFKSVQTSSISMPSNDMELDLARKA